MQTAVHASAQMHKRILLFQRLIRDKDQMIAQQETDIDSRHQAINQLQSVIACQMCADLEQKKTIATQSQIIAALQAEVKKSLSLQQQTMSASPQKSCKVVVWLSLQHVEHHHGCSDISACSLVVKMPSLNCIACHVVHQAVPEPQSASWLTGLLHLELLQSL